MREVRDILPVALVAAAFPLRLIAGLMAGC
jgi:hypothetical protein